MTIDKNDIYVLNNELYKGRLDGYTYIYTPNGAGGVIVIDDITLKLLRFFDGIKTIEQIIKLDGRNSPETIVEINLLKSNYIIKYNHEDSQCYQEPSKGKKTVSCWLHLTNECNLACRYCYIHKSKGLMSWEIIQSAFNAIVQTARTHKKERINIKLAGGEPLIQFDEIKKLVEYAAPFRAEFDIKFTLLTNGTLVTDDIASYIKTHDLGISISLDGVGETNDLSRIKKNGAGSFNEVKRGLAILEKHNIKPFIMITISEFNYNHLLEITKFCLDNRYRFRFSLERDCSFGTPALLEHIDDLIYSLNACYDYMENNLPSEDVLIYHNFCDAHFDRLSKRVCGAGSNFFAVGHDGKLGVCGLGLAHPFAILNSAEDLLDCVKQQNPELASYSSDHGICRECIWRASCAGGCPLQAKATYGSIQSPSPYCSVYKAILPRIVRIKALQLIENSKKH